MALGFRGLGFRGLGSEGSSCRPELFKGQG